MTVADPIYVTLSEARAGMERIFSFPDTGRKIAIKVPKGIRDGQRFRITYNDHIYLIPVVITDDPAPDSGLSALSRIGLATLVLLGLVLLYTIYVTPNTIFAFFEDDRQHAIALLKYNLTHFSPSNGPYVSCITGDLNTPQATELKQWALEIGQQLEREHGYDLTANTRISVVSSLGDYSGFAHSAPAENCIQLELHSPDMNNTIRHEWAHIAGGTAHGPPWQDIAERFGATTHQYRHCETGDGECQPRY